MLYYRNILAFDLQNYMMIYPNRYKIQRHNHSELVIEFEHLIFFISKAVTMQNNLFYTRNIACVRK